MILAALPVVLFLFHLELCESVETETLIGIVGRDFVLLGADSSVSRSIAFTATNVDKIAVVVDPFPNWRQTLGGTIPSSDADSTAKEFLDQQERQRWQQTIVAAVAGDHADADRLVGYLKAYAAIEEYGKGVGCDVEFISSNDGRYERVNVGSAVGSAGLSVEGVAHLARMTIYERLRSRAPFKVGALVAGMMFEDEPEDSGTDDTESPESLSGRVQQQVRLATSKMSQISGDTSGDLVQMNTEDERSGDGAAESQSGSLPCNPRLYWLDQYGSIQRMREYGVHGYAGSFVWSVLDNRYRPGMSLEQAHALMLDCFDQLRQRYLVNQVGANPPCIKCVDRTGCRVLT